MKDIKLSQPKLLLIDDEPLVLEMFETVLSSTGFDVTLASCSSEALSLLRQNEFEILVSDVFLEEFDGFDIHAAAKKLYPKISTILITGAPNPIDLERATALDIPYLSKPVGFDLLLRTINSCLTKDKESYRLGQAA